MTAESTGRPYRDLSGWLRERYGTKVFKVGLNGGFSCPNRDGTVARGGCTFCSEAMLRPTGYSPAETVAEQLVRGKDYIRRRHGAHRFIAYYHDGSATHAPPARLRACYGPALADPEVVAVAVGTRPDCLADGVLEVLAEVAAARDLWLELGLQIADDRVLAGLGRGHDVAAFVTACERLAAVGIPVCVHVIIGLPGVDTATELATADLLGGLGVWGVKLHAFHLVAGTPLAEGPPPGPLLGLDEHAERVVAFLERLPAETVVHRLTAEAARGLTVAPRWTVNKHRAHRRVVEMLAELGTWQGRCRVG